MNGRPGTRRAACREEVCIRLGYCGGESRWSVESDFDGETPDEVVDAVLMVEGLVPTKVGIDQRARLHAVVVDWLFDPKGKGQRSDLPR